MSNLIDITTYILKGSVVSLELFAATILFAIPLGILVAIGKVSKNKPLRLILSFYTWSFRGTPLLLQLFFIYFGLPALGIRLDPLIAATISFTLNYAAYLAEIFRAGIESVDKGQYEAARVLGLNGSQTMIRIIIPQTVRTVLPPVCNEAISLIKDSAMIAVIGIGDLLRAAKEIVTSDFTITPFIVAGILYLLITTVLVFIFRELEKRYCTY